MLLPKFPSLPLILLILFLQHSFVSVVISDDEDFLISPDLPLVEIGELNEQEETPRDWFRVRRRYEENTPRSNRVSRGEFDEGEQQADESLAYTSFDKDNLDNAQHEGDDDNSASGSIRSRRVYIDAPTTYDIRRQGGGGGSDGRCNCNVEYLMQYRSNPVYYNRDGGAFHVKVVHEETGRFTGGGGGASDRDREAIPVRNGWREKFNYGGGGGANRQQVSSRPANAEYFSSGRQVSRPVNSEYFSTGRQQVSRPANAEYFSSGRQVSRPVSVEYVVEEMEEPVRRRNQFFSERAGAAAEKSVPRGFKSPRQIRSKLSSSRKLARIARVVVKSSRLATLTVMSSTESVFGGYPYSQACRVSDGTSPKNSTGLPYIFLTPAILDANYLGGDLEIPEASLTISPYELCENDDQEEQPWKCASVILSGRIVPVTSTSEIDLATEFLTSRHSQRHFQGEGYFATMIIKNVVVQQNPMSGGAQSVLVNDYLY